MNTIECKDVLDGLAGLSDSCADVVICDPPYNIGKDFGESDDSMPISQYKEWAKKWITHSIRILKDSGTIYIYGFPEILCHLAVDIPIPFRYLVWSYDNKAAPLFKFWQRSHESILCCWKEKAKRIFNLDDVRIPYTDVFLKNAAGKKRKSTKGRFSHSDKETVYEANPGGALPRDVIKCPALAGGAGKSERFFLCKTCDNVFRNKVLVSHQDHDVVQHPTQKPYELTKRLLMAARPKEGGTLVVPFAGTGSECAVASDLEMSYIGFDNNVDYVLLATKFLANRKLDTKNS
jgi:site-specific DNA-methyltransferase (adenine-specific)